MIFLKLSLAWHFQLQILGPEHIQAVDIALLNWLFRAVSWKSLQVLHFFPLIWWKLWQYLPKAKPHTMEKFDPKRCSLDQIWAQKNVADRANFRIQNPYYNTTCSMGLGFHPLRKYAMKFEVGWSNISSKSHLELENSSNQLLFQY